MSTDFSMSLQMYGDDQLKHVDKLIEHIRKHQMQRILALVTKRVQDDRGQLVYQQLDGDFGENPVSYKK